jgi:hypothetical protein
MAEHHKVVLEGPPNGRQHRSSEWIMFRKSISSNVGCDGHEIYETFWEKVRLLRILELFEAIGCFWVHQPTVTW